MYSKIVLTALFCATCVFPQTETITATYKGTTVDKVGTTSRTPDGKPDACIEIVGYNQSKTISNIVIKYVSSWDTWEYTGANNSFYVNYESAIVGVPIINAYFSRNAPNTGAFTVQLFYSDNTSTNIAPFTVMPSTASIVGVSNYASHATKGNVITFSCQGNHKVRISLCSPSIAQVIFDPAGTFSLRGELLRADFAAQSWPPVSNQVIDEGSYIRVQTSSLTIRVQKSPFSVSYYNAANTRLITGDAQPMTWSSSMTPRLRFTRNSNERFFGWGQRYEMLKDRLSACDKSKINSSAMTVTSAPFMYSTGNYAVLCLFDQYGRFMSEGGAGRGPWFNGTNAAYMEYGGYEGSLDNATGYYFFAGKDWRDIIDKYTNVTGRPHRLAKKWYGVHYQIYDWIAMPLDTMYRFVDTVRALKIPCDVIRFDASHPISDGWYGHDPGSEFTWGSLATANPQTNIQRLVDHCKAKGYLVGAIVPGFDIPGWRSDSGFIETESQAAYAVDHGFDFAWYDRMGHISYDTGTAMYNVWKKAHHGDETMAFVSQGWSTMVGQARQGAHAGDNFQFQVVPPTLDYGLVGYHADYTDLTSGYSEDSRRVESEWSLMGFPLRPIINFHCIGDAGGAGLSSWKVYSFKKENQDLVRKMMGLHYRLIPYLFTYSMIAHETGMPVWRHMMCHDPQNADTYDKDFQAYVGEELMTAPYQPGGKYSNGLRTGIYMPPGTWYDFFEGTKYTGPQLNMSYNCNSTDGTLANRKMPIFVRAGAIVPLMEPVQFIGEKPESLITVAVWPSGNSSFTLYEDETPVKTLITSSHSDGAQTTVSLGAFAGGKYCTTPVARKYKIELHNVKKPLKVLSSGQELTAITPADYANRKTGWYFDSLKGGVCFVNAAGDASKGFTVIASYNGLVEAEGRFQHPFQPVTITQHARSVVVRVSGAGPHSVELLTIQGKRIEQVRGSGSKVYILPQRAAGVYITKVMVDGKTTIKKIVPRR